MKLSEIKKFDNHLESMTPVLDCLRTHDKNELYRHDGEDLKDINYKRNTANQSYFYIGDRDTIIDRIVFSNLIYYN